MKAGDRVIVWSKTNKEVRGFVIIAGPNSVFIQTDSGQEMEVPAESVEYVKLIPAHSVDYLRTLPRHLRPNIY
jgi:hypothetical protein